MSMVERSQKALFKTKVAAAHMSRLGLSWAGEHLDRPDLTGPLMVCTILTSRCNYRCSFCNHPGLLKVEEMDYATWVRILSSLKDWLGVFRINFLGGEPLLHPDLAAILAFCQKNDIMAGITTNASLFDEARIKELAPLGLFNISISVDGIRPEVHDRLRGVPGSHDHIFRIAPKLREAFPNTRIAFRTNVLEETLDDLVPLVEWVVEHGLDAIGFQPIEYRNLDRAGEERYLAGSGAVPDQRVADFGVASGELPANMEGHWVRDLDKLSRVIGQLKAGKKRNWPILNSSYHLDCILDYYRQRSLVYRLPRRCRTAWEHLVILPDGKVRSCTELPPFGNLHEQTPQEIWNSADAARHRELCRRCTRTCMNLFHWKRSLPEKAELFMRFF